MQERIYQTPIRDISELRQRLIDTWSGMQQSIIDEAVEEWRKRLKACVQAKGGHFEHLL